MDFAVWTTPEAPGSYTESASDRTATSVTFTGGSDVDDHIIRRFYASTEENLDFLADGTANQAGVTVVEADAVDRSDSDPDDWDDAGAAEEVTFEGLTEAKYYFYFVDYNPESGHYAKFQTVTAIMPANAMLEKPEAYDQDLDHEGTTAATIRFEGGSRIPVGVTRKVFYASEALPLDGAEVDDANTDVVQSFTMERPLGSSMGHAFTLGERPYVDHPDGGLDPNTEYHVIVQDSRGSDDSELSDEFTGWTAPAVPSGYQVYSVSSTGVLFSESSGAPAGIIRYFYASTSAMLGLHANGVHKDDGEVAAMFSSDNSGRSVPRPPSSASFGGLTSGEYYYFYFVDYNPASGLKAVLRKGPIEVGGVIPPAYTADDNVTTKTIPLTQVTTTHASNDLVRHFFVSANDPLSLDETDSATGLLDGAMSTFSVMAAGEIVLGDGKGAGSNRGTAPAEVDNEALEPNTQYFIYVRDLKQSKWSLPYDVTGDEGAWTRPKAVVIAAPDAAGLTLSGAVTPEIDVDEDTDIHWVLLKEEALDDPGFGEEDIKHAVIGEEIASGSGRVVINEGTLSSDGSLAFHEGASGFGVGKFAFYYSVEGSGSGLYANFAVLPNERYVKGTGFEVLDLPPDKPAYSVKTAKVTATTIPLMKDSGAEASPTLVRRFFVHTSALTTLATNEVHRFDGDGLPGGVTTFTVKGSGDVTIGDLRGGGDTANASNGPLTANTKYYLYVSDHFSLTGKVSPVHDIAGSGGVWTLPSGVSIRGPSGSGLTHDMATTGSVSVASDTKLHWVLLKEPKSISGLTGSNIKGTAKGSEIVSGRRVVNKGMLDPGAGQTIALDDGVTLTPALEEVSTYAFYYVVEGSNSGNAVTTFTSVTGVDFAVQRRGGYFH